MKFGTDGVRGEANSELTVEGVLALGRAAARALGGRELLIGLDTRRSGPLLAAALATGWAAEGGDATVLGVLPTPAVAFVSAQRKVAAAVISASHNPAPDNGVKFFAPGGRKLSDGQQAAIEGHLARLTGVPTPGPVGASVGTVRLTEPAAGSSAVDAYADHLVAVVEGRTLDGLRVVVDGANGAGAGLLPHVLDALGASVTVLGDAPDGDNINDGCGSTHPEGLRRRVAEVGADLGIALDGDADRCLAVDESGQLVDGDQIMAMFAIDLAARGALRHSSVAVTVMSNLGLRLAMAEHGIEVVETPVGDRHVLAAMDAHDLTLGGEQSGHIILADYATTGDGLLSGVVLCDLLVRSGVPASELAASAMTRLPQELVNVRLDRRPTELSRAIGAEVAAAEAELGERGRVLIRESGTEPVVRVMVEAPTVDQARRIAADLAHAVARTAS